jgi:hypothetical protein
MDVRVGISIRLTFPLHITVKAFLAIFAFELNGSMWNAIFFPQEAVNFLKDLPCPAHLDVAHQDMSAQGMNTRSNGP